METAFQKQGKRGFELLKEFTDKVFGEGLENTKEYASNDGILKTDFIRKFEFKEKKYTSTKYLDYLFETKKGKGLMKVKEKESTNCPTCEIKSYYVNYFQDGVYLYWELDRLKEYERREIRMTTRDKERASCPACILTGIMIQPATTMGNSTLVTKHTYLLPAIIATKIKLDEI